MQRRTGVDDDLPSYSENIEDQVTHSTLESMELDEDEAIDMPYLQPAWSFSNYTESTPRGIMIQQSTVPPTSDVDEDLFSDESNRAASPASEDSRRLHDFPFDEGTTNGAFGPHRSGSTPVQDIPPTIEDYDDMAVAEVRLGDNDEITRLD